MAFSPFATLGFVGTNYNKVSNGDWTRYPVLGGQCVNAVESAATTCAKKSSIFANAMGKVTNGWENLAKSDKVFKGVDKTVKFVKKNINPLIVASGATKVLLAKPEDREKTFYSEGFMIAGMFLGEGWMKKNLDAKVLSKLPIEGRWGSVARGVLFVAGSLLASTIGQKIGNAIYASKEKYKNDNIQLNKANLEKLQKQQKTELSEALKTNTEAEVYEPLAMKA